jgi:hypothetical protein
MSQFLSINQCSGDALLFTTATTGRYMAGMTMHDKRVEEI